MLAKAHWHNSNGDVAIMGLKTKNKKMVEIFKTDVEKGKEAILLAALANIFPHCRINFDLEDCDRVLRVEGRDICCDTIISLLNTHDCYCAILE